MEKEIDDHNHREDEENPLVDKEEEEEDDDDIVPDPDTVVEYDVDNTGGTQVGPILRRI